LPPLGKSREALYRPIALEIDTLETILGISLNDAMEERDYGRREIAWRLVGLAACEWDQLGGIVVGLLNTMSAYMPIARVVLPVRGVVASRFKSRLIVDYIRAHELLDQLIFRHKLRFQLQIRVLRRAAETLTAEFHGTYEQARRTYSASPQLWSQLDLYLHDFDLVAKETTLAFRMFLCSLPDSALTRLAAELEGIIGRGVRTTLGTIPR
jgi:hypothetical protein